MSGFWGSDVFTDYTIGEFLRQADIGICGERVSFIHCGNASDAKADLIALASGLEETEVVNLWAQGQIKRLAEVLYRPDILSALDSGCGVGILNREKFIGALR